MLMINIAGLIAISLIIWWFWLYKPKETQMKEDVTITVENGTYTPSHISIAANKPTKIQFLRKDQAPCSETLLIPELKISESLPINKVKAVQLPALPTGEYAFHCQMQMYRGKITVL